MNTPMPTNLSLDRPPSPGPIAAWVNFWFTAADPVALHAVRGLTGLLLLLWLLPLAADAGRLYSLNGWFDARAYVDASRFPDPPIRPIGWSVLFLAGAQSAVFTVLYAASVGVVVLFTLGLWTRLTAPLTWVVVASFRANPVLAGPADYLFGVFAYYLMLGYLLLPSGGATRAQRLLGSHPLWRRREEPVQSVAANVAVRLLQLHLAFYLIATGLRKLQLGEWWSGTVFWFDLFPPFAHDAESLMRLTPSFPTLFFFLSAAAYATVAWQIGFPLFAWQPRLRLLLVGGGLVGWVGAVYVLAQPLIGPALFVGCLAFLTPDEWRPIATFLTRLVFGSPRGSDKAAGKPVSAALAKVEAHS